MNRILLSFFISFTLLGQEVVPIPEDPREAIEFLRAQRFCIPSSTDHSPFYLVGEDKQIDNESTYIPTLEKKETQNLMLFESITNRSNEKNLAVESQMQVSNARLLPVKSVVRINRMDSNQIDSEFGYVEAEVLGLYDDSIHNENLAKSKKEVHYKEKDKESGLTIEKINERLDVGNRFQSPFENIQIGEKAFIPTNALKRIDDYNFLLKKDSPILNIPSMKAMNVVGIEFVQNNGQFQYKRCCHDKNTFESQIKRLFPNEKQCTVEYEMKLIYANGSKSNDTYSIDMNSCNVPATSYPLEKEQFDSYLEIINLARANDSDYELSQLEILDSRGLVKIPIDYDSRARYSVKGPFGSVHYSPDDEGVSDIYANPVSACTFLKVLEEQQRRCSGYGCQVQFGDIYHSKDWKTHSSHYRGDCYDIRPQRNDDKVEGLNIYATNPNPKISVPVEDTTLNPSYNQAKTKELIRLLIEAGATNIYFNDPEIIEEFDGAVKPINYHYDHVHFCLRKDNQKVQDTCKNGLSPSN